MKILVLVLVFSILFFNLDFQIKLNKIKFTCDVYPTYLLNIYSRITNKFYTECKINAGKTEIDWKFLCNCEKNVRFLGVESYE